MKFEKVELNWVKVDPANPELAFDKIHKQWSLDVLVDEETAQNWVNDTSATKIRPLKGREGTFSIKLKHATHWPKSGEAKDPVRVIDIYGDDVDPKTIGNGTIANVQYNLYKSSFGPTNDLLAVQVIDLVKYEGNGSAGDEFAFAAKKEVSIESVTAPAAAVDLNSDYD